MASQQSHLHCPRKGHGVQGPEGTFDFRLFLTDKGQVASFWHDIPLDNGDGTVNFVSTPIAAYPPLFTQDPGALTPGAGTAGL